MNNLTLYEKIPKSSFPIRLLDYSNEPYTFSIHWHEHIEIHYIFNGTATIRCADEIIELSDGDCVIVNGNELHQGMHGVCSYGCMILPPSFFDDTRIIFDRTFKDSRVTEMFTKIYESFRKQNAGYKHEIKGYANLLAAYLIQNHTREMLSENLYLNRIQKLDKINNAVQFINEHFTDKITTVELAKLTHLSEGHFCNIFKEATGMTAKEYINEVRIKNAAELISSTNMTITEAAMYSGFSDSNYFTKMFKKIMGKTPSSIRKN